MCLFCLFVCLFGWLGLVWFGLVWFGWVWFGLVWFGCLFVCLLASLLLCFCASLFACLLVCLFACLLVCLFCLCSNLCCFPFVPSYPCYDMSLLLFVFLLFMNLLCLSLSSLPLPFPCRGNVLKFAASPCEAVTFGVGVWFPAKPTFGAFLSTSLGAMLSPVQRFV